MAKKEKWQEEIEELLDHNMTISEWIIHDYVWEQPPHSSPNTDFARLMQAGLLLTRLIMASPYSPVKPDPASDRERWAGIRRLLHEAGCPDEIIDDFFRRVSQIDMPKPPWKDGEEQEPDNGG